jgi:hypothetical protein
MRLEQFDGNFALLSRMAAKRDQGAPPCPRKSKMAVCAMEPVEIDGKAVHVREYSGVFELSLQIPNQNEGITVERKG